MKRDRLAKIMSRSVFDVAKNWMSMIGQLHAQLMSPASSWPDFQPRQTGVRGSLLVLERCFFAAGESGRYNLHTPNRFIFLEPSFQLAGRFLHVSFDHCPINFCHSPITKLFRKSGCSLAGASKEKNSRHHSIQSMNDP